jgi:hypothetical protein
VGVIDLVDAIETVTSDPTIRKALYEHHAKRVSYPDLYRMLPAGTTFGQRASSEASFKNAMKAANAALCERLALERAGR